MDAAIQVLARGVAAWKPVRLRKDTTCSVCRERLLCSESALRPNPRTWRYAMTRIHTACLPTLRAHR